MDRVLTKNCSHECNIIHTGVNNWKATALQHMEQFMQEIYCACSNKGVHIFSERFPSPRLSVYHFTKARHFNNCLC